MGRSESRHSEVLEQFLWGVSPPKRDEARAVIKRWYLGPSCRVKCPQPLNPRLHLQKTTWAAGLPGNSTQQATRTCLGMYRRSTSLLCSEASSLVGGAGQSRDEKGTGYAEGAVSPSQRFLTQPEGSSIEDAAHSISEHMLDQETLGLVDSVKRTPGTNYDLLQDKPRSARSSECPS